MKILVTDLDTRFQAWIEDQPHMLGIGATKKAALGDLICKHQKDFMLEIKDLTSYGLYPGNIAHPSNEKLY